MKKYSIIIALFLVVAIFGAVFFVGKNKKEVVVNVSAPITTNVLEPITTNTQTSTTTAPKKEIVSTPGVILIGDRAKYENLSEEEKHLMGQYYTSVTKDLGQVFVDQMPISGCYLKYYDAKVMMVGCVAGKPGLPLSFVERETWGILQDELSCGINLWNGIVETNKYIIAVSDGGICYYKVGDKKETTVPNSDFMKSDGKRTSETYVKIGGLANTLEISFDEPSKTLTAVVFKRDDSIDPARPNRKTRTATFVLP